MNQRPSIPTNFGAGLLRTISRRLTSAENHLGDAARVARFLQGHLEFQPRPDDIYVASYPRSGTTWVQFIVYLLTSDRQITFTHLSEVSPWWERTLARGTQTAADFAGLTSPRRFKSHLLPGWLPSTGRFIYIQRDVKDVALSYYHFYRSHLGFRGSLAEFVKRFQTGDVQYRSWFDHVRAWEQHGPPQVLHLRYEELKTNLEATIQQVARFLNRAVSAEILTDVLHKASFTFMKMEESRFDPITETLLERGWATGQFLRQGHAGEAHRHPDRRTLDRLDRASVHRPRWPRPLDLAAFLH